MFEESSDGGVAEDYINLCRLMKCCWNVTVIRKFQNLICAEVKGIYFQFVAALLREKNRNTASGIKDQSFRYSTRLTSWNAGIGNRWSQQTLLTCIPVTEKAIFKPLKHYFMLKVYFVFWSQKKNNIRNVLYLACFIVSFCTLLHYECKSNLSANGHLHTYFLFVFWLVPQKAHTQQKQDSKIIKLHLLKSYQKSWDFTVQRCNIVSMLLWL